MTDPRAFEAFLLEYQDMVYATAVRLLGNAMEAEDVAQTVFLKAFERFDQIGASPTAAGWLKTVTTNACLNHLSRYRNRWSFFSELGREDSDSVDSRTAGPEQVNSGPGTLDAGLSPEERALDEALVALPPHQRVPIVLFHFDDLSYQDIAERLGVSIGKIKTDIHRGREALRQAMTAALGAAEPQRRAR
ncbi:MAG TPA: RNA polymerase sigma factor [Vicinamibacterales bacterium]|nr:RNA polymerase sigma factor [Vicinamibacterales bacterium]